MFQIAMSCMSPLYGRFSQIFSPRYIVLVAAILFTIGAFIASQARSLAVFLVGRAFQGVGAAGILTLSIILVIDLAGKKHRGLFIGLANTAVTTGVSLGAVIGGALAWTAGWRFLMWVQVPIALVCGTAVCLSIPNSKRVTSSEDEQSLSRKIWNIDYSGALLLVLCLVSLSYGLSHPKVQVWPIIAGVVLLVIFVLNELYRATAPIIPISVLRSRGALLSCFGQMGFMTVRWSVLFYTPIYAQAVRLWSPTQAGAILVPTNAGFAAGGLVAGALHIRRAGSFWMPSVICYSLFPVTMLVLSQISTTESSTAWYIFTVFVNGFTVGAGLNYCLAHMLHLTTPDTHFVATSLLATFRGFSGTFGAAAGGGLFTRLLYSNLEAGFAERGLKGKEDVIRQLLGKPALVRQLTGLEQEAGRLGYQAAIEGLFLAGVGLAILAIFVQAGTGWKAPESHDQKADQLENGHEE